MSTKSLSWMSMLGRTVLVVSFLLLSAVLVASANGYLYDRQTRRFEQTGIINVTIKQSPVTVTINNKKKLYKQEEITLAYLLPGLYNVEVSKPGFRSWVHSFNLAPGQVIINPFMVLFLDNGPIKEATPPQIINILADPEPLPTDLDIRGSEIWAKPISRTYPFTVAANEFSLIGRYSSPILAARWLEGKNNLGTHIIFQVDKEIRVIDRDGTNDLVLATLESSEPSRFITVGEGKFLIYEDGERTFQRQIQ